MSKRNFYPASSEEQSNNNQFCSERGCYRTLHGWSPNRKQPASNQETHQVLAPEEQGEADE